MRVTKLIFFLSFIFFNISNLASGQIKFTELSWDETNKLISEQFDKPILLYFYFDGCGVCKKMEKSTFQDTAVFEYLNKHYLCYKINTLIDHKVFDISFYNVKANPTFIFLNDSFSIQRKIAGYYEKQDFLDVAKSLFSKIEKSYNWYKEQFDSGNKSESFLLEYCNLLANTYELDSIHFDRYIESQVYEDLTTVKNLNFIFSYCVFQNRRLLTCNSPAFISFYSNSEIYFRHFDSLQVRTRQALILNECILDFAKSYDSNSFFSLLPSIKNYISSDSYYLKTQEGNTTMIFDIPPYYDISLELYYYDLKKNLKMYESTLNHYTELIWDNSEILNIAAWYYVDSFNDFKKWKQAEKWSIRSIELEENYSNIDTYANILFKLGNSKKALEIAEKAIWLAKANNEDFSATTQLIEKIKTVME